MSGFDSSDDDTDTYDESPLKIDWLDLSAYGCDAELGIGGLPGCRFKDTWRKLSTDIGCLKSHGVCEVFCFCTRGELQKYRTQWLLSELTEADISVHHCAFPDGAAPPIGTLMTLLEEIRVMLMQGKRTYIHCFGGLGRSGLVSACLLQLLDTELSAEDSIQKVRDLRGPGAIQSIKQFNFVNEFRAGMADYQKQDDDVSRSISR